jgi:homeobox protein cut-like
MEEYATGASNNFRSNAEGAVDIDLTALIPNLDTAASDLVAHQRDSLVQRKDLAQKTKDFRKLDDSNKLNEVKGLLKGITLVHPTFGFSLTLRSVPNLH